MSIFINPSAKEIDGSNWLHVHSAHSVNTMLLYRNKSKKKKKHIGTFNDEFRYMILSVFYLVSNYMLPYLFAPFARK